MKGKKLTWPGRLLKENGKREKKVKNMKDKKLTWPGRLLKENGKSKLRKSSPGLGVS